MHIVMISERLRLQLQLLVRKSLGSNPTPDILFTSVDVLYYLTCFAVILVNNSDVLCHYACTRAVFPL